MATARGRRGMTLIELIVATAIMMLLTAMAVPMARSRVRREKERSEEHTSELQSHSDLHSFPTRRSSDLTGHDLDRADRRHGHHDAADRDGCPDGPQPGPPRKG